MQKEKTFLGMLLVASLTILLLTIWVHSDPKDGNPLIKWIDDHHVSVTYKGRAYESPDTKIIEY